ncbi:integrin alpha [Candidatus Nitrosopelagicus sp.]|nr:integrin alpha [Candidatus Nitrosopelagicus sp.]
MKLIIFTLTIFLIVFSLINHNAFSSSFPELDDYDTFGNEIIGIGDFDGDGIIDLAVGASEDDDGGKDKGAIYILFLNSDATVKSYQKISDTSGNFDLIKIIINFFKNIFF